ncbi:hypothetical protein MSG28_003226 [Choristoneura fumiferana]|uniref:Uncharacterized protein n=1 Tax=Choristoneura fumiferana TaxID=7141 RepID=A0ACC0KEE7_CHOFU|nr:hypothetical protein MSG28_003226 [Choristoneura fumiferana]
MSESNSEETVEELLAYEHVEEESVEVPMSEWSSLDENAPTENKKKLLFLQGLYKPSSEELCAKYIAQSDSEVFRHHYYNYPPVADPGIRQALNAPEQPIIYPDDGEKLYLAVCKEMNLCPVGLFYKQLSNDEINLSYYGVNPMGVRAMAMALQYNKSVKRFTLTDNFLNDDAAYHLGQMLVTNTTLQELDLSGCRIRASGMLRLGSGMIVNTTLKMLNVSRNELGEEGGQFFADHIVKGCIIPRVNLSRNKLGRQAVLALWESLSYRNKMTYWNLSGNMLNVPGANKMLEELATSTVLQELDLSWNGLQGTRIAEAIQTLMANVGPLKVLDLSNNRFCNDDIPPLIDSLIKCKKLTTLNLSFNPLTPQDSQYVIEGMLRPRVKVQNLLMDGIWVSKKFIRTLETVKSKTFRKNFKIIYGGVLENYTIQWPDPRPLLLNRIDFVMMRNRKKNKIDIGAFFLQLRKEIPEPAMPLSRLIDEFSIREVDLSDDLINELGVTFAHRPGKPPIVSLQAIEDYVRRMWPDRKAPPTPPPEPEPEPPPPPPEPETKGKKGKKGK